MSYRILATQRGGSMSEAAERKRERERRKREATGREAGEGAAAGERLQGFPDGFTIPDETPWQEHPKPDGPRYAQMGNAVTVPVAEWIGRRIMEYGR